MMRQCSRLGVDVCKTASVISSISAEFLAVFVVFCTILADFYAVVSIWRLPGQIPRLLGDSEFF